MRLKDVTRIKETTLDSTAHRKAKSAFQSDLSMYNIPQPENNAIEN